MEVKISLDKLSFVGFLPKFKKVVDIEKELMRMDLIVEQTWLRYPYKYQLKLIDGAVFQFRDQCAKDIPDFRVEWNPNKARAVNMLAVMDLLREPKCTRADVAVDYIGLQISEWYWQKFGVERVEFRSKNQNLETVYLGRNTSNVMIRIYDKAKEQKTLENGPWTRIEAVLRREAINPESNPFDTLKVYKIPENGLKQRDKVTLFYLAETHRWTEYASATRTRYRKIIDGQCQHLDPHPAIVWEKEKARIWQEIQTFGNGLQALFPGSQM